MMGLSEREQRLGKTWIPASALAVWVTVWLDRDATVGDVFTERRRLMEDVEREAGVEPVGTLIGYEPLTAEFRLGMGDHDPPALIGLVEDLVHDRGFQVQELRLDEYGRVANEPIAGTALVVTR